MSECIICYIIFVKNLIDQDSSKFTGGLYKGGTRQRRIRDIKRLISQYKIILVNYIPNKLAIYSSLSLIFFSG